MVSAHHFTNVPKRRETRTRALVRLLGVAVFVSLTGAMAGSLCEQPPSSAPARSQPQKPAPSPPPVDVSASVPDRVRLEAEAQRARERLAVLAREAERLDSQQKTLLNDLRRLELARERHALEEAAAKAAGAAAQAAVAETNRRIAALESAARARAPAVRARLRRLYQLGALDAPRYWIRPEGLIETARAWRLLAMLASRDRALFASAGRERAELTRLRREQEDHAAEVAKMRAAADTARAASQRAVTAQQAMVARVQRDRELADRLMNELQQAEARLGALLAGGGGAGKTRVALPLSPFKGDIDWPLNGRVTRPFGTRREGAFGTLLPRTGMEIAAAAGTPVAAIHDGRVAFADQFAGLGRLVIVDHGGNAFSLYGDLDELRVSRGESVVKGTPVGTVGATPTGQNALYFELRIDGRPVDPLKWLKPSPAPATHSRP